MKSLIRILAPTLLLAATVTLMAGESIPDIPPAARSNLQDAIGVIHHAVQLAKAGHVGPKERKEYWQQADRFDEALDRLAESVEEAHVNRATGEETIEAKLLVIAWDRKHRHELYDEIESKYVSIEAFLARGGYAERSSGIHGVDTRHQTEAYRLIWEYLLIRPLKSDTRDRLMIEALYILKQLGDERSLVTIHHRFALNRYNPHSLTINEQGEQGLLLSAISGFASEAGLRTLLECLELTREQPRVPSHYHKAWDPEQEVILLVTSPWRASEAPDRWRRWEQAVDSHVARSPDLSERQQRFLGDLRKALGRQNAQP